MATVTRGSELLTIDSPKGFTTSLALNTHVFRASCQVIKGSVQVSVRADRIVKQTIQQGQTFYVTGGPDLASFQATPLGETTPVIAVNYEGDGARE